MEEIEFWKTRLNTLDKRIKAFPQGYRQNIAILGDDEKEISYLLENYFKTNKLKEIIYIHTSASHSDRKSFFKSVVFSLLSEYLNKNETFDNLLNCTCTSLSTTVVFIKDIIKRNTSPSFLDILEVVNKFINESGKRCIFIIENLLALKRVFPSFHNDFSKFIVLQRNCMVILTSLDIKESEKTLYSDLNFLFGNFEKILLNETNFLENYKYLKNSLIPLPCSPFFISFFVNIFGSNIVYYNFIKEMMKEKYINNDEDISIISIVRHAIYEQEAYFFQKFIREIDIIESNFKNPYLVIKLLLALSEGYIRKKELASLHIIDQKDLTVKLQRLCDLNYVENLGNIYTIKDPLFSFWLSHVFKLSFCPPLLDWHKRNILFEKKMHETISLFKEDFFKDKVKKILELITSFKNDTLKIGKTSYRLPLVTKSRLISYPEKNLHFLIAEGEEIIFAGIKEVLVEDSDIFDFIEKGKMIRGKGVKKIFISLDTFSSSAKLAAKNNKLIVWDINELNDLMRTYHKPVISFDRQCESRVESENFSNF
ncbi:MAG: hypothetical protein Q8O30_03455 [Candidatus Omnitrophota bacterium]|nr:hypothetical protein [Candidatus Omnitrophota bacterium]